MPDPKAVVERWWLFAFALILLVLPLGVVLWSVRSFEWGSLFDLALIEVKVREVGTAHTPLLGVTGRLGHDHLASHPGPLAFYSLAPAYRLFGGSILALRLSFVLLTAVALAIALLAARRMAGRTGLLALGISVALLHLGFGLSVLTQFWNPHIPVPWFVTFLVAVWATVAGRPLYLPLAAGCASLCAQAHVSYLAACAGPLGLAALVVLISSLRSRREALPTSGPRALALAVIVIGILWAPPFLEEWRHAPGNLAKLTRYFLHPPTAPVGVYHGSHLVLRHLDPVHLVVTAFSEPGALASFLNPPFPSASLGGASAATWLVAAAAAHWLRSRQLLALHAVVAVSLVTALAATSRIIGGAYPYLIYWCWMVGMAALVATLATVGVALGRRRTEPSKRARTAAEVAGLAVIAAACIRLVSTMDAPVIADFGPATQLGSLARQTAAALLRNAGASTGREGRYLVTWSDALHGGGQGIGLANELTRRGFAVGVTEPNTILFGKHWGLEEQNATARVHFANAAWIHETSMKPGAVQLAYVDRRTPAERREYLELQALVQAALRKKGRSDAAERLPFDLRAGGDLVGYGTKEGNAFRRMMRIGVPAAVFVEPIAAKK